MLRIPYVLSHLMSSKSGKIPFCSGQASLKSRDVWTVGVGFAGAEGVVSGFRGFRARVQTVFKGFGHNNFDGEILQTVLSHPAA